MTSLALAALFVAVFLIERLAEALNIRSAREPLPAGLTEVQSTEEQKRAADYLKDRVKLAWVRETFFLVLFIGLLLSGFFGWLQAFAYSRSQSSFWQAAVFAGVLALGQLLFSIPFSAWSTFSIEERWGFNRTSAKTFVGDLLKGLVIGAILGGVLFYFAVAVFERFGSSSAWIVWAGYTLFQFFIVWIAPVALLPLFLKLEPLPEGELRRAIEGYARQQKFKLDGVWLCDASKRSAKSNAFFTGFGRFRRLVLFDTLIARHPTEEIVAIVAHEAGHFKLGHIWKGSLLSAATTLGVLLLLQYLIQSPALYAAFQAEPGNIGIGLTLAVIVLGKILYFISPLSAYFSRRNEFAADRFSMETTRDPGSLVSGLKRLVKDNLSTLKQHPLHVTLHATHPPLPDRIKPLLSAGGLASE